MKTLEQVIARSETALATVERKGVSADGFHSCVSISAGDLRMLVDAARITALAAAELKP